MTGLDFGATGYCVSTVGLVEQRIREYIREQEQLESGQGQLDLKQAMWRASRRGLPVIVAPNGGFTTRTARSGGPS